MNIEFYNERIVGFCEAGNRILSLVLLNYVNVWFAAQQTPELRCRAAVHRCTANGRPPARRRYLSLAQSLSRGLRGPASFAAQQLASDQVSFERKTSRSPGGSTC
jgi:hypothetical protein